MHKGVWRLAYHKVFGCYEPLSLNMESIDNGEEKEETKEKIVVYLRRCQSTLERQLTATMALMPIINHVGTRVGGEA